MSKSLKQWRRGVTDPLVYVAAKGLVGAAGMLRPGARRTLAHRVGGLLWRLGGERRRVILANLQVAFPEMAPAERDAVGLQSLQHTLWNALDFLGMLHDPAAVLDQVDLDEDLLRLLDARTRPTLAVIPHLGNWELFGHAISLRGVRVSAVASPLRNPYLDRLLTRARSAHGLQVIPADGAVRAIVKAVRGGRHIGMLVDQNTPLEEGGAYVSFFGLPATISRAPAVLARRLGLEVVAAACLRTESGFRMVTVPLPMPVTAYADDQSLLQAIIAANEALVRAHPEHYVWTYRRWRYVPDDCQPDLRARYPFYAKPYSRGVGRRAAVRKATTWTAS